ncbi:MAG: hypothetical protein L6R38_000156 [Xanthoria sp. 2 TBL-2021]|nr:MAG: hypothetical protein L6R38_000156 [Xanthoria sp. 2 TBL-2021]
MAKHKRKVFYAVVPREVDAPAAARGQQIGEGGNDLASIIDRIESGRKIPQEAVLDLKIRAGWKRDLNVLEDQLPRYWVAQIPNLILARDDGGVFDNIKQGENQKDLRRLVWLLREIITAEKVRKDRKLEVRCKSLDALELREQDTDEHDMLPSELKLR